MNNNILNGLKTDLARYTELHDSLHSEIEGAKDRIWKAENELRLLNKRQDAFGEICSTLEKILKEDEDDDDDDD